LQQTLNHIYVIDLLYVDALEGGWLGPKAWKNPIPFPGLAELSQAQALMDQRLIVACNALTPALLNGEVRINRGGRVQVERRDRLLLHLIQHQIHHRGQAHAMLSGTRIKPPQLDEFFSVAEAPLRALRILTLAGTALPAVFLVASILPAIVSMPSRAWMTQNVAETTPIYGSGGFAEVLAFRVHELPRIPASASVYVALNRCLDADRSGGMACGFFPYGIASKPAPPVIGSSWNSCW
jgi:uncharacterized damage-inducible protein DinB